MAVYRDVRQLGPLWRAVTRRFPELAVGAPSLLAEAVPIGGLIAKVQGFDALVQAVQRKLEVLDKLSERRVELATAYRARRSSEILGYLTVLSLVAVAGGVVGVTLGSYPYSETFASSRWWRVGVVLLAAAGAGLFYFLAFVRTRRRPAPTARARRSDAAPAEQSRQQERVPV